MSCGEQKIPFAFYATGDEMDPVFVSARKVTLPKDAKMVIAQADGGAAVVDLSRVKTRMVSPIGELLVKTPKGEWATVMPPPNGGGCGGGCEQGDWNVIVMRPREAAVWAMANGATPGTMPAELESALDQLTV